MALILPNRFYRQPTTTLIDQGNPISRGLNSGYLASTRSFFGTTTAGQTSPNSTYRYDQRFGIATMGTIGATALATVFAPVSGSSDMTLLSVFFPATGVSETFPGNVGQTSNAISFGLSVGNGTTNVIRGRCYLSGTRYFGGSTTITDFNKPIVAVTRQKVGVEQALFVNGVKDPTTTAFAGATFNTQNIGVVGAGANQAQFLVGLWGRALSDTEIWDLAQDPYQIFHRPNRRIWVDVISSGVSGTLATTNANDTVSASGTTTIVGTLAKTNAADTVSASGTTTVTGTLAKTNANDSVVASGAVGSSITGTVATTNANDTSAASGTTTVTGSLAKTNTNDSVSASGTTTIVGSLATTNANDSVVASGAAGAVTGTVAYTNANDTVSASGTAGNESTKVGGDDVPERVEIYEKRKKRKKNDDALDSVLRDAMDKAMGREPVAKPVKQKPVEVIAEPEAFEFKVEKPSSYDDEEDEEYLLLMMV
jgi:hypothetical protein